MFVIAHTRHQQILSIQQLPFLTTYSCKVDLGILLRIVISCYRSSPVASGLHPFSRLSHECKVICIKRDCTSKLDPGNYFDQFYKSNRLLAPVEYTLLAMKNIAKLEMSTLRAP
jgi:hypothetical protein